MESKSKLLNQRVAIVTGAGRGIGKAISERFLAEGAIVYGIDLQEGSMDELMANPMFHAAYFDITDQKAIREFFIRLQKEYGRLDILVNNAGIMKDAYLPMITDEVMEKTFAVNVFAIIHLMKYAVKFMRKQKSGSINIRVNAVAPGVVETDMIKSVPDDQLQILLSKIGLRRLATAGDIADVYLFLASDLSRYVSGQVLGVDGMMIN